MKLKILLATLAIVAAPSLAIAECSWGKTETTAMSCAEGTAWDATAQTCVPLVAS